MTNALMLALAYMRFYWLTSLALILSIALTVTVPVATRIILNASEVSLGDRAHRTPLLLGTRGSSLDLTLAALYFDGTAPQPITHGDAEAIWDSELGMAIPLFLGITARQQPVVGTGVDYLDFRGLSLVRGRPLARIGEAVLGADAARHLGLGPGDTVVTDAQNLFDLAGIYPFQLTVTGVLAPSHSADDAAIFVDLNTAWILAGIGHGHSEPIATHGGLAGIASPAIQEFNRITPENIDSFHLHSDPDALPVSAVIVVPQDHRASAILQGRYLDAANPLQLVTPSTMIEGVLTTLFRIGHLLDMIVAIVGAATLIAVGLALGLATRLRADELSTLYRLGAHRMTVAMTVGAQITLIMGFGVALAATFLMPLAWFSETIVRALIPAGA